MLFVSGDIIIQHLFQFFNTVDIVFVEFSSVIFDDVDEYVTI